MRSFANDVHAQLQQALPITRLCGAEQRFEAVIHVLLARWAVPSAVDARKMEDALSRASFGELEERIWLRAYQLYEQRGKGNGHALDDLVASGGGVDWARSSPRRCVSREAPSSSNRCILATGGHVYFRRCGLERETRERLGRSDIRRVVESSRSAPRDALLHRYHLIERA